MDNSRRGFLGKILSGSVIMGAAGIFSLKKDIVLANELDLKEVENYDENKLLELCNDMLNAMDGRMVKHQFVADFVSKQMRKGTFYENVHNGAVDVTVNSELIMEPKNGKR